MYVLERYAIRKDVGFLDSIRMCPTWLLLVIS